jgi:hypothetical protein
MGVGSNFLCLGFYQAVKRQKTEASSRSENVQDMRKANF